MKKLIILEINEVPFKVYDHFIKNNPDSALSRIVNNSRQFITKSSDQGELHPWSTWPTFYRGVDNTVHQIKDIGEDLTQRDKDYPPVWNLTVKKGISSGIFASLHTHPLPADVHDFDFLIPDPFANGPETHPGGVQPFQAFNLSMTRRSGRSVDKGIDKKAAMNLAFALPRLGLRVKTLGKTARQLLDERREPWKASRRRTFQSILAFDLFLKLLKTKKPQFVTYFSNHVASAMHRYWAATFPEDYDTNELPEEWINQYKNEIPYCMNQLNFMVSEVEGFIKKNPGYKLLIASSMGQEATTATLIKHELFLGSIVKFGLGMGGFDLKPLTAMHPQYNFEVVSDQADRLENVLNSVRVNDSPLSFRRKDNNFFSIDLGYPNVSQFDITVADKKITKEELGLEIRKIDDQSGGTAYHIPEGTFFIYDPETRISDSSRKEIDLREVAPALLDYFDLDRPTYMMEPTFSI